jgi:phosphate transport system permease protein
MTDFITPTSQLRARKNAEQRFQWYGRGAIFISLAFLVLMVGSILMKGMGAFGTTNVAIEVDLGPEYVDPANPSDARFEKIVKDALKARFPEAK